MSWCDLDLMVDLVSTMSFKILFRLLSYVRCRGWTFGRDIGKGV